VAFYFRELVELFLTKKLQKGMEVQPPGASYAEGTESSHGSGKFQ
jgi:hypothetical protein